MNKSYNSWDRNKTCFTRMGFSERQFSNGEHIFSSVVHSARSENRWCHMGLQLFDDVHVKSCGESFLGRRDD